MIFNKKIKIVTDCDEILTYITPLWYAMLCKNKDYFGKYFVLDENFSIKKDIGKVLLRDKFYLNDYYSTGVSIPKNVYDTFISLIDFEEFYPKYCKPSIMAKCLADIAKTSYVTELHIVSRSFPHNGEGKKEFLRKIFKDSKDKLFFHILNMEQKKSDIINEIGNVDVFFDDELSNIRDVIENCGDQNIDIYIPKLGYNKITIDYIKNAMIQGMSLNSYHIY